MEEGIRVTVDVAEGIGAAREVQLPSGSHATIRCGNGRDLRLAQMAAGEPFDDARFEYALIARLTMLDGRKIKMEEVDELPIGDVLVLQREVSAANFPPPAAEGEKLST